MIERARKVVRHAEDVAGEIGRAVIARILHILLEPTAHILRFGARVEHVLHRRFEIAFELGERIVDRGFGPIALASIALVAKVFGHAFHFARHFGIDRLVLRFVLVLVVHV